MTYVGDANDPATILADADVFFCSYFAASDDDQVDEINRSFTGSTTPPYWYYGRLTSALIQVYDLVAPLDPERGARYLQRLARIAGALLANRDDKRDFPADPFRQRVMSAWGAYADDRDGQWNTDVVTSGLFTYAMAAFARRVAARRGGACERQRPVPRRCRRNAGAPAAGNRGGPAPHLEERRLLC